MNIRRANPKIYAVLGLIQELAVFEKEPDAVLVTVDDLIRGFGPVPLFHVLLPKLKMTLLMRNKECKCTLLLSLFDLKGKTIHLEDLVVKTKCVVLV
jgi:hypothetical protein